MELFDLYDDERNFTGETIERGKPLPESRYHLDMHFGQRWQNAYTTASTVQKEFSR